MLTVKNFSHNLSVKKSEVKEKNTSSLINNNATFKAQSNENLSSLNKLHFSNLFVHKDIGFGRKPIGQEAIDSLNELAAAMKVLGIKDNAEIVPGTCFPIDNDGQGPISAVGTPYSAAAKGFIKFLKNQGINAIQLGPTGEITPGNVSPYSSTVFGLNTLYIDPKNLSENPKWVGILSKDTVKQFANDNKNNDPNYADYGKAFKQNKILKQEIYNNYKKLSGHNDNKISNFTHNRAKALNKINSDFNDFKDENDSWLQKYAHYEVLTNIHGNDYFGFWPEGDKNLYADLNGDDAGKKQAAENKIKDLNKNHKDEIEEYKFAQFVAFEQAKDMNKFMADNDMKFIGDAEVGNSNKDMWAYKNVFDPNYKVGCAAGDQRWGFPLVDPNKIFQTDDYGNIKYDKGKALLKEGGEYIRAKYSNIFKNCKGGVRVDNVTGTVDPEVYVGDGAIRSLSDTGRDPKGYFSQAMEKIILTAADANGIDRQAVFGEDIAKHSKTFSDIYYDKLRMSGVSVLQYQRGQNIINPNNRAMIGSHDNMTLKEYSDKEKNPGPRNDDNLNYLSGYLIPGASPEMTKAREDFKNTLSWNNLEFAKAKLVELDTCPTVNKETFWPDNIIYTDQRYNIPGGTPDCWKLKINEDYENQFYNGLANNWNPYNPHETFKRAIQARDAMDAAEGRPVQDHSKLTDDLEKTAGILREKKAAFTHNPLNDFRGKNTKASAPEGVIKAYNPSFTDPIKTLHEKFPGIPEDTLRDMLKALNKDDLPEKFEKKANDINASVKTAYEKLPEGTKDAIKEAFKQEVKDGEKTYDDAILDPKGDNRKKDLKIMKHDLIGGVEKVADATLKAGAEKILGPAGEELVEGVEEVVEAAPAFMKFLENFCRFLCCPTRRKKKTKGTEKQKKPAKYCQLSPHTY